jgi:hypothetical protein
VALAVGIATEPGVSLPSAGTLGVKKKTQILP